MRILTIALMAILLAGCGNLSPRQEQQIENSGTIGEIDTMANSMKAEVGKVQNQNDILNSKLDKIQQGMINYQNTNENSGVQILSGSGGICVALLTIVCSTVIILHYRKLAFLHEKTAKLLTESVVAYNDPQLTENVFKAAMYSEVEGKVLNMVKSSQKKFFS